MMKRLLFLLLLLGLFTSNITAQKVIEMERSGGVFYIQCKVNGLPMKMIFDTGASGVNLSLTEAIYMLKNGYLTREDIGDVVYSQIANGEIVEETEVIIKEIDISGMKINNVKASISHEMTAPLLLGQSVIQRLGTIQISGNKLIIMNVKNNKEPTVFTFDYTSISPKPYTKSQVIASHPHYRECVDKSVCIYIIAKTQQFTIIEIYLDNPNAKKEKIDPNTAIYADGIQYRLVKSEIGKGKYIRLYFPSIPTSATYIDLVENNNSNIRIHGITISNN